MVMALLVSEIVIGSLYVIASLFLNGEISLFLYGFGWGIFGAALAVLLAVKT
jgi:Na+/pantothenate symporter